MQAPVNTTKVPNGVYPAGINFTHPIPPNLFTDPDGDVEDITLSAFSASGITIPFLYVDFTAGIFYGVPAVNTDVGTYTIKIIAEDTDILSSDGYTYFNITVVANQPPRVDQGLQVAPQNVSVHYEFSYTVPSNAFMDPEGETIYIRHQLIPNNFPTTFNQTTRTVTGTLSDNSKHGTYQLRFYAEDKHNLTYAQLDMNFQYFENLPPVINSPLPQPP